MTVPATSRRSPVYLGDGSATAFAFAFKVFAATDIQVIKTDTAGALHTLVLNSDYSVALNADQDATPGGTVTFPISGTKLATGEKLVVVGSLPYDQPLSLPGGGNYSPAALGNELDRIVMQLQQVNDGNQAALHVPIGETVNDLPAATDRANKQLTFDASGQPQATAPVSGSAADVLIQLADSTSLLRGSGLVAHKPSNVYADATVGGVLRRMVIVPDPTGADDTTIIQTAVNAVAAGGTVRFPEGKTYVVNTAASVVISTSGITLDFNGSTISAATANSVPAFAFIPASLVSSGRLVGTDYPASWKNGSTPLPMDLDFDSMMHESTGASRLTNIVVKNAYVTSACNRGFIKAYSVDGLRFENCNIAPAGQSALRVYHSSKIVTTKDCYFGGTGTYLVFLYKCMAWDIDGTFESSTAQRAISFKGVMHPIGTSIFASFGANYVNVNGRFAGKVLDSQDAVFWDTTPNFTEDAVGARGGAPIGFTSGTWFGKGLGFDIKGSMACPSGTPGANGNQGARGIWISAPHRGIEIDSTLYDCSIMLFGVVSARVTYRFYGLRAGGVGYVLFTGGDTPSSTDGANIDVLNCHTYGFVITGTATSPIGLGHTAGKVQGNQSHSSGAGTAAHIVLGANFSGISNYLDIRDNVIYYATGTPLPLSMGTNNTGGLASGNIAQNTSTGARTVQAVRARDDGGGTGIQLVMSDDATGFAGFAIIDKATGALKVQLYRQASDGTFHAYYEGADRAIYSSVGSKFLTGLYPPKDDGTAQASARLFAGSGLPNNANGANGDYYLRSDTPGTANQRLYVRSAGAWVGIV